jgi:hypothetical protein
VRRIPLLRSRNVGTSSIVVALLLALPSSAQVRIPDPATSTVPPCLTICPSGDRVFSVVVRDIDQAPMSFATVTIDLSNCADAVIALCEDCAQTNNYDPVTRRIVRYADVAGVATFQLCGSVYCPSSVNWALVSANGVGLRISSFVTTDLDGDLDVDGQDVVIVTSAQGGSLPPADQDCSGTIDGADVAIVEAHGGHGCLDAPTTILITEVEADPVNDVGFLEREWFELQNVTGQARTLTNWSIADNQGSKVLPTIALGSGECIVVAQDSTNFRASHPGFSGRLVGIGGIGLGLDNVAESLVLRDDLGSDVDCVSWGTNVTCSSPAVAVPASNTVATLQRTSTVDTDTAADWTNSMDETPCPGVVGVEPPSTAGGPRMTIAPNPGSGHTTISCSGIAGGAVVVTIHDVAGRRVRTLRDETSGSVRNIAWNGLDERGCAVPTGVYLVTFAARPGTTISERLLILR